MHVRRVAGIVHVGPGSDFEGIPVAPAGGKPDRILGTVRSFRAVVTASVRPMPRCRFRLAGTMAISSVGGLAWLSTISKG